MFVDAVEQEKKWADYLFKDGFMICLMHSYCMITLNGFVVNV